MPTHYIAPADVRMKRLYDIRDKVHAAQQPCLLMQTGVPSILHWDAADNRLRIWAWCVTMYPITVLALQA